MYHSAINGIAFHPDNPLVLIAGPCVIESEDHCLFMANALKSLADRLNVPFIFKSSYLKANRSSIDSYVGPGLIQGLKILEKVKNQFSVPVLSDVHSVEEVGPAAEVLDIIQIPAFLCRQTALLVAVGETGRIVNVKKGQFLSPYEVKNLVQKVFSTGNHKVLLTERGSSFGYNNLVVDMRSLEIMKGLGVPVVFDATHSVQLPGSQGSCSGGQKQFVACLAKAAVAVGVNALFVEVHDRPDNAMCDGSNMITPEELASLMPVLQQIDGIVKGNHR
jgi:2-dehydro-3-deoxyphosphooctonate aldolase (KDO 8-P synthase)